MENNINIEIIKEKANFLLQYGGWITRKLDNQDTRKETMMMLSLLLITDIFLEDSPLYDEACNERKYTNPKLAFKIIYLMCNRVLKIDSTLEEKAKTRDKLRVYLPYILEGVNNTLINKYVIIEPFTKTKKS